MENHTLGFWETSSSGLLELFLVDGLPKSLDFQLAALLVNL